MFTLQMARRYKFSWLAFLLSALAVLFTDPLMSFYCGLILAAFGAVHIHNRKLMAALYDGTAEKLNIARAAGRYYPRVLEGSHDGFTLKVEEFFKDGKPIQRLTIDGRSRKEGVIPPTLSLEGEKNAGFLRRRAVEDRIIGDEQFDSMVLASGAPKILLALLEAKVRSHIIQGLTRDPGLRVEGGVLSCELAGKPRQVSSLADDIRGALALAQKLTLSSVEVPSRLARHARDDPQLEVRRRNLQVLADVYSGEPALRETLRVLLNDRDPEIRFHAARAMGEEGFDTLRSLVSLPGRHRQLAARSLAFLAGHFPAGRILDLVREALGVSDGGVRAAALRALGVAGDSSDESHAVAALSSEQEEERRAAVEALGGIGTASSVAPLRALAAAQPLDFALKKLIDKAVSRIRERLTGAEEGQLTLAGDKDSAGRMSLADEGREGRLEIVSEQE